MAYNWGPRSHECYPAGADLSTSQFLVVKREADGDVVVAGAGEGFGILDNAPLNTETADVVTTGTTKVKCGATVAIGDRLIANAAGKAIPATAGTSVGLIFGTAREAGAADTIIAANVDFSGAVISAVGI
jgi:hypothetical protein